MILGRSPFYITTPIQYPATTKSVTYRVWCWNGNWNVWPTQPTYEVTKNVPSTQTTHLSLDVSGMVMDFIEPILDFNMYTGVSGFIWGTQSSVAIVRVQAVYNDDTRNIPDIIVQNYATAGYGEFNEGSNYQPDRKILLSQLEIMQLPKVMGRYALIPIWTPWEAGNVTVTGNNTNLTFTPPEPDGVVGNYISYLVLRQEDISDEFVTVSYGDESVVIQMTSACRELYAVRFLNKYGAYETIYFTGKRINRTNTQSDEFVPGLLRPNTTYNRQRHQFRKIDLNGRSSQDVGTGLLYERQNETIVQLVNSEYAYIEGQPVNVSTSSLDLKTVTNDKMISYTIGFTNAFNKIQNV